MKCEHSHDVRIWILPGAKDCDGGPRNRSAPPGVRDCHAYRAATQDRDGRQDCHHPGAQDGSGPPPGMPIRVLFELYSMYYIIHKSEQVETNCDRESWFAPLADRDQDSQSTQRTILNTHILWVWTWIHILSIDLNLIVCENLKFWFMCFACTLIWFCTLVWIYQHLIWFGTLIWFAQHSWTTPFFMFNLFLHDSNLQIMCNTPLFHPYSSHLYMSCAILNKHAYALHLCT